MRLSDTVQAWGAAIETRIDKSGIVDRIFTDRVIHIIGYITGAAGPLQRLFAWLRQRGIGERVIKSTIAAVAAYWVASLIPGNPHPTFAPISAVYCINLTIAGGMHGAGQRVVGIMGGILLATFVHDQINQPLLAVGLVVFISFYMGRQLKLEPSGTQQITMTAMLVIFIGSASAFEQTAWLRVVNTMIGTAIGLIANASVAPNNLVPLARSEILTLGNALASDIKAVAQAFRNGMTHDQAVEILNSTRQTAKQLQSASDAVDQADQSLKFNLQGRSMRETLGHYQNAEQHMTFASVHSRTLARATVDLTAQNAPQGWLAPAALGTLIADLVDVAGDSVQSRIDWIEAGDLGQLMPLDTGTLVEKQSAIIEMSAKWQDELDRGGIFYLGEIVALSIQIATEMSDPADEDD